MFLALDKCFIYFIFFNLYNYLTEQYFKTHFINDKDEVLRGEQLAQV